VKPSDWLALATLVFGFVVICLAAPPPTVAAVKCDLSRYVPGLVVPSHPKET
jgi:hypothetical protein